MMRLGAAASGTLAAAVAAVPKTPEPLTLSFLGMPFEAPSMIAAMFGVTVTRVIIGQTDKSSWRVKLPVDALAIGVTFFLIVERRPELLAALMSGIFIGTLGATIIKIAERWGAKMLAIILPEAAPVAPPPSPPPPSA